MEEIDKDCALSERSVTDGTTYDELWLLRPTGKELKSIAGCFALAAALICANAATSNWSLMDMAASVGAYSSSICALNIGAYLLYRGKTKPEAEPENREKLHFLRTHAEELRQKFGMSKAPEILVWKKNGGPSGFGIFKPIVAFSEATLREMEPSQLEEALAHEMAHLKMRHGALIPFMVVSMVCGGGLGGADAIVWGSRILVLPVVGKLVRTLELQADRLAAVVTGRPKALINLLKQDSKSASNRARSTFEKMCSWIMHPSFECRAKNPQRMGDGPERHDNNASIRPLDLQC